MRFDAPFRLTDMYRNDLIAKLNAHRGFDKHEEGCRLRTLEFVRSHSNCFERSLAIGHVTGSAWLVDPTGTRVLLTHHKKLDKWLQLGGHADGEADVLRVAIREAQEESGLTDIAVLSEQIFDIDIHNIAPSNNHPFHDHYDVRFLLQARGSDQVQVSDESHDLAWVSKEEFDALDLDASVLRMYRKWLAHWLLHQPT